MALHNCDWPPLSEVRNDPLTSVQSCLQDAVALEEKTGAGIRAGGQVDAGEAARSQASTAKEGNVGSVGGGGEKSQTNTPQAAGPMLRYAGVAGVGSALHAIRGRATAGGSSTSQAGGSSTSQAGGSSTSQAGTHFVLASEVRSPAMNFSTGMAAPGLKDASGSASGGSGGQAASGGVKISVKKVGITVGQKKPGEAMPAASQPGKLARSD